MHNLVLSPIGTDELIEAIADRVLSKIETKLQRQKEASERFLTVKETAKVLNLTEATIYSKVCKRELPFHKQGKQLRFLHSELVDYIKQGRKKTNAEIEAESKAYLSENRKEGKRWN